MYRNVSISWTEQVKWVSEMSSSRSPTRSQGERARSFDGEAKRMCWAKAETVPGRHPERWRKDSAGNILCKRLFNCQGCLCFEYDHIIPFSKGGESIAENCQILQTRVNRLKSNKDEIDVSRLKSYSCDIKFTAVTFYSITPNTIKYGPCS
ncbi:uncharacterized protein [Solanum lycopersicum]|uniref:uncharacterized protein isoform X2 n=1 Tax=Solanum lycopersicum TaxID=4081 RepID=UPI0008FEC0D0|nr:uncharacterized protein LOC101255669 isoform X2 [Solanum lycopersicum]